jgi:hypothetical protein
MVRSPKSSPQGGINSCRALGNTSNRIRAQVHRKTGHLKTRSFSPVFLRPREWEKVPDLPGRSTADTGGRMRVVRIKTNPVEQVRMRAGFLSQPTLGVHGQDFHARRAWSLARSRRLIGPKRFVSGKSPPIPQQPQRARHEPFAGQQMASYTQFGFRALLPLTQSCICGIFRESVHNLIHILRPYA